ncbi:energy transducer TonB [Neolewinella sp.]|uniref:energy transducer TonB n=1 Tax=Neolewinella sp. TaxID=2993543 RepID=UPI003B525343
MNYFLLFSLLLVSSAAFAQSGDLARADTEQWQATTTTRTTAAAVAYSTTALDREPALTGEQPDVAQWLASRVRYPELAADYAVEGEVIVRYLVHPDGRMTDVSILQSVGYGCDSAVLKALAKLPRWTPARKGGQAVATWCETPVNFSLR